MSQESRKVGGGNERPDERRATTCCPGEATERGKKLIAVVRMPVRERPFEVRPDEFVGIEFGGVARESLNVEPWTTSQQREHIGALMNGAAVPDHDDVLSKVTQQSSEEQRDLDVRDVVKMKVNVETEPATLGADGDGGDRRDPVVAVAVPHDRRFASRGPGPTDVGNQQEPGLVEEDERGVQAPGFFLMALRGSQWVLFRTSGQWI